MGFFVVTLEKRVRVHPRFFRADLKDTLTHRLTNEVESTFAGKFGFIIAVVKVIQPLPRGELDENTGFAVFPLKYRALVFRPFKGEVLDAIVSRATQHGFFAEAGPLTIFVSHHLLPSDMSYDAQAECWISIDQVDKVEKNSAVRIRIIGLKIEATEISATGSMRDDYLGVIE